MSAPTTQHAHLTARSKELHASSSVPVPTDVNKLGLNEVFRLNCQRLMLFDSVNMTFNLYTGCNNCPSEFCTCRNFEENPDYIGCMDDYELVYKKCMTDCDQNDALCYATCNREYGENIEKCPCKSDCPNGCPCPEYDCSETEPLTTTTTTLTMSTSTAGQSNSTVLVLNSNGGWKPAEGFISNFSHKYQVPKTYSS